MDTVTHDRRTVTAACDALAEIEAAMFLGHLHDARGVAGWYQDVAVLRALSDCLARETVASETALALCRQIGAWALGLIVRTGV